jgi:hypothetical protein
MPQRLRILWQLRRALAIILMAPLLAGCGSAIEGEELGLCREVVPAVEPAGTVG